MNAPSVADVENLLRDPAPAGDHVPSPTHEVELAPGREYLRKLAVHGWAVPTWPVEHGGCGATEADAAAIRSTVASLPAPDLYAFGIGMSIVGPTLLTHGTTEQQQRWLRPIATGDRIVCQMFSEPDAGSDVANLATRATRDGDVWSLQGQKVWTSRGMYSDWGLCLTRTDPDAPKHRGLTMFMIDMRQPGVTVTPLHQMDGEAHFTEVFLDGATVSDADRVGDIGQGWAVAMTVLANERAGIARGRSAEPKMFVLPSWLRALAERGDLDDRVRRDRAMRAFVNGRVLELTARRSAAEARSGTPGPGGSGGKLRIVRTFKERAELCLDTSGANGMLRDDSAADDFLLSPSMSLRGGTDEVQLNIIGERILGLPSDVRLDRDVPWTQSRNGLLPPI
ncbi:acyl-CoA dehydrogenase family protein [Ilumatobacter nonamiensis]|uniref:acyl-CoA dehydrogenase family protein n=1 Tax=Ilumatobacter nonamiensis TaxID=467093 RepID=UPI00034D0A32|nr:acyl-CoA dehydrogenase family protein [Ilumatobacter nonamiensis]